MHLQYSRHILMSINNIQYALCLHRRHLQTITSWLDAGPGV